MPFAPSPQCLSSALESDWGDKQRDKSPCSRKGPVWRKQKREDLFHRDKEKAGGFPEEEASNLGLAGSIRVCQVDKVEKGILRRRNAQWEQELCMVQGSMPTRGGGGPCREGPWMPGMGSLVTSVLVLLSTPTWLLRLMPAMDHLSGYI